MNRQFLAFRGFAIVLVVLHHASVLGTVFAERAGYAVNPGFEQLYLAALRQVGVFAVPTFLFLSGCFFVYAARVGNGKVPLQVVWQGLQHILFPYLIWSIVFYIIVFWVQGEVSSPFEYIKKLLTGYPYNFVPLIVFYYLLSPVLVWMGKHRPRLMIVTIGLYQIFLLNVVVPGIMGVQLPGWARFLTPPVIRETLALWGVYFPLGIIYGQHMTSVQPTLLRYKFLFLTIAGAFLIPGVLTEARVIFFPIANQISAVAFVLALPVIRRESIPGARWFEKVSKRAYGLYLTNLVILDLLFYLVRMAVPGLLQYLVLLVPVLFYVTISLALWGMTNAERLPQRAVYRTVFG